MTVDENITELICTLEYKIGKQTYNPNSYNGWTGEEGCSFRYPVQYCKNKEDLEGHNLRKSKGTVDTMDPECVRTMKYAFGSNHLYIGDGIVEILEFLEERYGISFNSLEEELIEKKKNHLRKLEIDIENGKSLKYGSGKRKVGIDIPIGAFRFSKVKDSYSQYLSVDIDDEKGHYVKHIFTTDDDVLVDLKEGYIVSSYGGYLIKRAW